MRTAVAMAALFVASVCFAQTHQWERTEKTDPLRGTDYSQFILSGKFLTPPRSGAGEAPIFFVKCIPGGRHRVSGGYKSGKFLDAYIVVHAVVDTDNGRAYPKYRLDDSKIHDDSWGIGTDGTAVFPEETGVNTLLYGHFMPHKEGTNGPVHKVVIAVNEYLGAEVVMQFDMPDPSQVADACGLIVHRK